MDFAVRRRMPALRPHASLHWIACDTGAHGRAERSTLRATLADASESDDVVGVRCAHGTGKRGPAPKLQQQLERITRLPKAQQDNVTFVELLKRMMKGRRRPIHLVVDGLPAHKTKAVRNYVDGLKGKLTLHFLPGYASSDL